MNQLMEYFPDLTDDQLEKYARLKDLYADWNEKINVISRKDIDNFYERHVVHSLGIAKVYQFKPGTKVLDVGTGGGFPGIPLAIMFPEVDFHLVDSVGKKIKVVNGIIEALGLKNVKASHDRAENVKEKYHFVISRAVTRLSRFIPWIKASFAKENIDPSFKNGILYLKGGDLKEELSEVKYHVRISDLSEIFKGEFFETKKVVYLPMS